eukprot:7017344-Pyramimonas_sp.AAC.2
MRKGCVRDAQVVRNCAKTTQAMRKGCVSGAKSFENDVSDAQGQHGEQRLCIVSFHRIIAPYVHCDDRVFTVSSPYVHHVCRIFHRNGRRWFLAFYRPKRRTAPRAARNPDELARVLAAGGTVDEFGYICGEMAPARAIGDVQFKVRASAR